MNDLNTLCNTAIALREHYYVQGFPSKDFRAKVLGTVINKFFVYGKIPSTFDLQFPMPVSGTLIFSTLEDLFSSMSMEIRIQSNAEKLTSDGSVYYAIYTVKEKAGKT